MHKLYSIALHLDMTVHSYHLYNCQCHLSCIHIHIPTGLNSKMY